MFPAPLSANKWGSVVGDVIGFHSVSHLESMGGCVCVNTHLVARGSLPVLWCFFLPSCLEASCIPTCCHLLSSPEDFTCHPLPLHCFQTPVQKGSLSILLLLIQEVPFHFF